MDIKDVENLAELAKIELTNTEKQGLLKDLEEILGYVKQIQEVKVEDIEPDLPAQAGYKNKNVWREDILARQDLARDLIINQFPDSKDGFVKVKKIL